MDIKVRQGSEQPQWGFQYLTTTSRQHNQIKIQQRNVTAEPQDLTERLKRSYGVLSNTAEHTFSQQRTKLSKISHILGHDACLNLKYKVIKTNSHTL